MRSNVGQLAWQRLLATDTVAGINELTRLDEPGRIAAPAETDGVTARTAARSTIEC